MLYHYSARRRGTKIIFPSFLQKNKNKCIWCKYAKMHNKNLKRKIISNFWWYWMEILPINIKSLYSFFIFARFLVVIWFFTFNLSSSKLQYMHRNFSILILTACNCIIYFQYSGNVENDHFNHTSDHLKKCEWEHWNILQNISLIAKSLYQICYFCCQCSIKTTYYDIFEAGKYYCMYFDFSNWLVVMLHFVSYLAK